MNRGRKLTLGLVVAGAVLGLFEAGHYLVLGVPPAHVHVGRVSSTELVPDGDGLRLSHHADPRLDVHVAAAHTRPRVVTVGGSSVRNPGPDANNWPWQLQLELGDVEVVNLGSPGQTMAGVRSLMTQLEPLSPDLIVVYSGHNDLSQMVFTGMVSAEDDWMLSMWALMGWSWIGYYLTPRGASALMDPNHRGALAFAHDSHGLELQPELLERYEEDLRGTLESAPAPVVLTTLLRNFDQGPQGLLTHDADCQSEAATVPMNNPDHPAERALRLEAVCGETAVGAWLLAQDASVHGHDDEALEHWYRSLALDPYPLRATADIDAVIRRVSQDTETLLVDLEDQIGPLVHDENFIDTLHPSALGARQIASELAPVVRARLGR
jgi:lysophospholipase L1-like esterase